jgi:hypothetical protein
MIFHWKRRRATWKVQKNAQAIRKDAEAQKATFGLIFNCGYGLGSFLVLLGSILKLRLPDK